MARPTKLTPERQEKICENIRLGMTYKRAALAAGISPSTFYSWKARGESEANSEFSEFLEVLKEAEAESEAQHLVLIEDTAKNEGRSTKTCEVFKKGDGVVYFLKEEHGLVKIGQTTDFECRFKTLQYQLPYNLEVVTLVHTFIPGELEKQFHTQFADKRTRGEWFMLSKKDIDKIKMRWALKTG